MSDEQTTPPTPDASVNHADAMLCAKHIVALRAKYDGHRDTYAHGEHNLALAYMALAAQLQGENQRANNFSACLDAADKERERLTAQLVAANANAEAIKEAVNKAAVWGAPHAGFVQIGKARWDAIAKLAKPTHSADAARTEAS